MVKPSGESIALAGWLPEPRSIGWIITHAAEPFGEFLVVELYVGSADVRRVAQSTIG
jgi:hypothetical protein